METPVYIALSRQSALRRDLNTVANNIANASTTGYRAERTLFQEYLAKTGAPGNREKISFAQDIGGYHDTKEGPLTSTGRRLDVALRGDGYFVIGNPGQDMYTRKGEFHIDADRQLTTAEGYPVLSRTGQPIVIPANDGDVVITGDGTVRTNSGDQGQLRLVRFADDQLLRRSGNGFYITDQTPLDSTNTKVAQGALEGSNVEPILEITRMVELSRDYQSTQKLVDSESERQRSALQRLVKTSA